jgi:hypothetical protein
MKGDDIIHLLGKTYRDPAVQGLLQAFAITKVPKLKRGDDTAIVSSKENGVEITFCDERFLDVRSDIYEEGDLVLDNVRLYGSGNSTFSQFAEPLPLGLAFDLGPAEVEGRVGAKPAWGDRDLGSSRWDLDGFCLFVTFAKKVKGIRNLSIQLPVS